MQPIDHAWALLKAIPQTPSRGIADATREEAYFRESLPDFPLGRHMETVTEPDYRTVAGFGEPDAVLGGGRNMRERAISPYDSDITRESAYESPPRRNPNQFGIPKTHKPPKLSPQSFIDALDAPRNEQEHIQRKVAEASEGYRATHPLPRPPRHILTTPSGLPIYPQKQYYPI